MLPPRPPFDTATIRRKTKNVGEQHKNRPDATAALHPTVPTAAEALPMRANPVIKKRDSFEVRMRKIQGKSGYISLFCSVT